MGRAAAVDRLDRLDEQRGDRPLHVVAPGHVSAQGGQERPLEGPPEAQNLGIPLELVVDRREGPVVQLVAEIKGELEVLAVGVGRHRRREGGRGRPAGQDVDQGRRQRSAGRRHQRVVLSRFSSPTAALSWSTCSWLTSERSMSSARAAAMAFSLRLVALPPRQPSFWSRATIKKVTRVATTCSVSTHPWLKPTKGPATVHTTTMPRQVRKNGGRAIVCDIVSASRSNQLVFSLTSVGHVGRGRADTE